MKKVRFPFMYHFCSFKGEVKDILLRSRSDLWHVHFIEEDVLKSERFDRTDLVYLAPNANKVIEDIDQDKVYVIGGTAN